MDPQHCPRQKDAALHTLLSLLLLPGGEMTAAPRNLNAAIVCDPNIPHKNLKPGFWIGISVMLLVIGFRGFMITCVS
jgi:hypothetical protein